MGVKYLRKAGERKSCNDCYGNMKAESICIPCDEEKLYIQITAAEFNASTGKKYRVKKDGRVLPYETP